MGCCMSCFSNCCSKNKQNSNPSTEPNNDSQLMSAQQKKFTTFGHKINQKVFTDVKQLMSKKMAKEMLSDPEVSDDFKTVFGPPFNACNQLLSYLYLTGIGGLIRENIIELKITLIINATYEWPSLQTETITTYRVPVDDSTREDISIYFDEVSDKIESCRLMGRALVHCMAGASRSTTLVLAYLIKYNGMPLKSAFQAVKKRRETARPNICFWEHLIRYEIRIRGLPSVRMLKKNINGVDLKVPDLYETDYPNYYDLEVEKQIKAFNAKQINPSLRHRSQKQFNEESLQYQ